MGYGLWVDRQGRIVEDPMAHSQQPI